MSIREEIVEIDGVPTGVVRLGNLSECDRAIVVIPGNPGLGGFYIPFAHRLFDLFDAKSFVLVVSHAGHSPPAARQFTLDEQIQHKIRAVEELILREKKRCPLVFVGHSIGSYVVLNVLDHFHSQYQRAFLLFPTIERMAESDAGRKFQRWFSLLIWLLPLLSVLVRWLVPFRSVREKILSFYFSSSPRDDRPALIETVEKDLFNPFAMRNILRMAREEMRRVTRRPVQTLGRHLHKLVFYYGTNDHWVPQGTSDEMRENFPQADITLCTNAYLHAFVLKHSKELARFVFQKLSS